MKGVRLLKLGISLVALVLVGTHAMRPDIKIDVITLGLILVAVLPWLSSILESAEFPGGWKIKFRDVAAAGQKVAPASMPETVQTSDVQEALSSFWSLDSNLALVNLRIEIEKRLRNLAEAHGLPSRDPLTRIVTMLQTRGVLGHEVGSGLQDLIAAGNKAAHGISVEPSVAGWAIEQGPRVLAPLDALVKQAERGQRNDK